MLLYMYVYIHAVVNGVVRIKEDAGRLGGTDKNKSQWFVTAELHSCWILNVEYVGAGVRVGGWVSGERGKGKGVKPAIVRIVSEVRVGIRSYHITS